jgi:hypothetical protein
MRRANVALVVFALALSACGEDPLVALAEDTCEELDSAIVLQVGGILSSAINDAEDLGHTAPELGDALREECPELLAAVEGISEEQEERDNLINEVSLEIEGCFGDEARGSVTNNSSRTVDVFIDVQFLDESGVVIESGIGNARGLRPGETGRWDAHYFGNGYDRCRAVVSNVFES